MSVCMVQVPNQYITAVTMIPDIDSGRVSVTVNGSQAAASLTAQVQVMSGGTQVTLDLR